MTETKTDTIRTARWQRVARYIVDFTSTKGYAPSVREIGAEMGWSSTSTVANHLDQMEAAGLITRESHGPRTIAVTEKGAAYADRAQSH